MLARNPGFRRERIKNLDVFRKKPSKITVQTKILLRKEAAIRMTHWSFPGLISYYAT